MVAEPKQKKPAPVLTRAERIAQLEAQGCTFRHGSVFPPLMNSAKQVAGRLPEHEIEAWCCRAKIPWPGTLGILEGERPKE